MLRTDQSRPHRPRLARQPSHQWSSWWSLLLWCPWWLSTPQEIPTGAPDCRQRTQQSGKFGRCAAIEKALRSCANGGGLPGNSTDSDQAVVKERRFVKTEEALDAAALICPRVETFHAVLHVGPHKELIRPEVAVKRIDHRA